MILINLLPQDLRQKETPKLVLPDIPIKKTLIGVSLFLISLQLLLTFSTAFFVWRESALKSEIQRLGEDLQDTKKIKLKTVTALGQLRDIRSLTDKKFYWTSILGAITDSITKGVWLRNLSLDEVTEEIYHRENAAPKKAGPKKPGDVKKDAATTTITTKILRLEGSVMASGQETAFIGKYVKSLKDNVYFSQLFSDVEVSNINQRKIKEFDVFDFVLFCKFKKGKA